MDDKQFLRLALLSSQISTKTRVHSSEYVETRIYRCRVDICVDSSGKRLRPPADPTDANPRLLPRHRTTSLLFSISSKMFDSQ
ncbi:hypothetical protein GCK72_003406 [Caenorhabditis remanei]|uniref:Uncharacterized protein n=1 Tax=Caenorhabditis remanei TaxID=31234 RepID=A0A6A5HUW1_CAERE|nr:hypothetical protein GCK72_003406 [Caenorhabditis remanei]KAF1771579.1 hypothetical protein GCK72_003406 [Caenorhabditis remanei]